MRRRIVSLGRAFAADARGAVLLPFVLALLVLLGIMGLAVDYITIAHDRSELQTAADTASLAASRAAADYLSSSSQTFSTDVAAAAATVGQAAGQKAFAVNIANTPLATPATANIVMNITSLQNINANVTASAGVGMTLLKVLGFSQTTIGATSGSIASLPVSYYQFVFLVDVSGSMTIGGSDADNTLLTSTYYNYFKDSTQCQKTRTSFSQCAFACHDPNNVYPCKTYPDKMTRRTTATTLGVKLKIDYVKSAISTFLSTVNTAVVSAKADATASIYTFATNFSTLSSSVSLTSAQTTAAAIQIETIDPNNNWGYTNTTTALNTLATKLSNVGDGRTSAGRKTYVVFVSDGLEDNPGSGSCTSYGRCTGVSYGTGCTKVKNVNTNLTFISLEATYPVVKNDTQYNTIVAPYATSMGTTMKSCASSGSWFFSADDGPGIESQMAKAVQQITNTLRIAN